MPDAVEPGSSVSPVTSCYAGDPDYAELLEKFSRRLEIIRSELQMALDSADRRELVIYAHRLKGSAGGYGFFDLSQAAWHLEQAATANDATQVEGAWEELSRQLQRAKAGFLLANATRP